MHTIIIIENNYICEKIETSFYMLRESRKLVIYMEWVISIFYAYLEWIINFDLKTTIYNKNWTEMLFHQNSCKNHANFVLLCLFLMIWYQLHMHK